MRKNNAAGGILLESAVVLPVFLFIFGVFIDGSLALVQHALSSFAVTKMARDLSINTDCHEFDETTVEDAKMTLSNTLATLHVTAETADMTVDIEPLEAGDPDSDGAAVPFGPAIHIKYDAQPVCVMCFVTKHLFAMKHSATFLLEQESSKECV